MITGDQNQQNQTPIALDTTSASDTSTVQTLGNAAHLQFTDIYNKDTFSKEFHVQGANANTADLYGMFWIADAPCEVVKVQMKWKVAASNGTMNLEKLTGTTALDAGVTILAADLSLTTAAYTTKTPALTATKANRVLQTGDTLAAKDAGTLADLRGFLMVVTLRYLGQGHYRNV